MSLQPISIFCFIFLHLSPAVFSADLVLKHGCLDRCGNLSIPYPFGVGSDCSLNPSFTISCIDSSNTDPPKAYLSIIDKEVIDINQTDNYVRVKYPNLVSICYNDFSYKHSTSVNLSGTGYTLSRYNSITAIGCDDMVLGFEQSNRSYVAGGCSALCADTNDTAAGIGYCPNNASSLSNGCCQAPISGGKDFLGAQLLDLSGKLVRKKLFPCSYAFIQEGVPNETVFSYPLYYLDNSTALLKDNWASTTRPPVVKLDWRIGAENCSRAELSSSYACQDNKSVCDDDGYYGEGRGYLCRCVVGYDGNPYLPEGCKPIAIFGSIARYGCQDQCGKLSIPFPFGVGPNCYLEPSFEVICNKSTNPPIAYLAVLNAEIRELNSTEVQVFYPNKPGLVCYNLSHYHRRISKTQERSLVVNLSTTQYTLSDKNLIFALGCDHMVVGIFGQGNRSSIGSGCATVCSDRQQTEDDDYGYCPYGRTMYRPGDGCCSVPIPRGTSYLEANLIDISGQWPGMNFSCSYTYIQHNFDYGGNEEIISYNSTEILENNEIQFLELDWRIGEMNCKEARRNLANYACQNNSYCIDFDATIRGYRCNCSEGYQGNPYLNPGCQDINECDDNTTNPCNSNSICINSPGSFHCLCPKGYSGDGRKDGNGCIYIQPKSKIILIGMGSGLGFLLFLSLCFWLYKVWQKRKEKIIKEKFFKRNGGLLLQQQTNEGALGKTKVFPAKELEIATDNFNESRVLGQGGQGRVYKGMLSDGKIVAIKKSKLVEENQLEQFINEVVILSQINHRNVVKLLGCCLETEVPLLVYEFMPHGTLFDLIHDPSNEFPLQWNMRVKIAADIAGALAYLHSASSMPIYHSDIKSSNILLDEKYVVKVSDFGTSRSVAADQTHLTTMVKGTFGYLDPEYFQSSQFTEKSDVYSFGVVLVELLTGQRPISLEKTEYDRSLATRFLTSMEGNFVDKILDPQVLEQGRMEEVMVVARLAQRCLNLKGKMRPTMKEVATELESFRISQMSTTHKDESEEETAFEDMPTTISDIEYTWTASYKSVTASSSSDTHPLL
ncbi:hypothetical protein C2S53_016249 [Perilla frutescens var. hirtella]|uniref:Uncharacterized protein n=1 Tax=Perilla frutescens var. hirtella TaxID=608512 RepID=A0AAD4JGT7_PERFH|nr:hypothetical protein C2S53_016249 [Perilla frutescens var. hirtella]